MNSPAKHPENLNVPQVFSFPQPPAIGSEPNRNQKHGHKQKANEESRKKTNESSLSCGCCLANAAALTCREGSRVRCIVTMNTNTMQEGKDRGML